MEKCIDCIFYKNYLYCKKYKEKANISHPFEQKCDKFIEKWKNNKYINFNIIFGFGILYEKDLINYQNIEIKIRKIIFLCFKITVYNKTIY